MSSGAETSDRDIKEIAKKINESKTTLVESEAQKRKILGLLYSLNQKMKKVTQEKSHLTDELIHVQANVKQVAHLIAALEQQIDSQRSKLKNRLRALYKLSGNGYLGILFSQTALPDVDRVLHGLKIITDADFQLIREYQQNVSIYKEQRAKLKAQVENLMGIEQKIKSKENLLVEEHKAKIYIVSELDQTKVRNLSNLQKLRRSTASLAGFESDETLASLMKPSFFEHKGQMVAPVAGKVVQDFGLITDEKFKVQLAHKGWRYATQRHAAVATIFDGKVIYNDWINGYGPTVIIDHGDHYYTVYSDLFRIRVKTGDEIKKGEIIAQTGAASLKYGEGLYFEIRHFSESEDPAHWLQKGPVQISLKTNDFAKIDSSQGEQQ